MREIKFRIYLTDYKYFAYFDLNGDNEDDFFGRHGVIANYGVGEWQQYTGLKDKNGVEIYEGDIVTLEQEPLSITGTEVPPRKGVIEYVSNRMRFQPIINTPVGEVMMDTTNQCQYTVIGNIYETPELLPTQPDDHE